MDSHLRFVANITRDIFQPMDAINVILQICFTAEHLSAVFATIILLRTYRFTIIVNFQLMSLKELIYFAAYVASVHKKE